MDPVPARIGGPLVVSGSVLAFTIGAAWAAWAAMAGAAMWVTGGLVLEHGGGVAA